MGRWGRSTSAAGSGREAETRALPSPWAWGRGLMTSSCPEPPSLTATHTRCPQSAPECQSPSPGDGAAPAALLPPRPPRAGSLSSPPFFPSSHFLFPSSLVSPKCSPMLPPAQNPPTHPSTSGHRQTPWQARASSSQLPHPAFSGPVPLQAPCAETGGITSSRKPPSVLGTSLAPAGSGLLPITASPPSYTCPWGPPGEAVLLAWAGTSTKQFMTRTSSLPEDRWSHLTAPCRQAPSSPRG